MSDIRLPSYPRRACLQREGGERLDGCWALYSISRWHRPRSSAPGVTHGCSKRSIISRTKVTNGLGACRTGREGGMEEGRGGKKEFPAASPAATDARDHPFLLCNFRGSVKCIQTAALSL